MRGIGVGFFSKGMFCGRGGGIVEILLGESL